MSRFRMTVGLLLVAVFAANAKAEDKYFLVPASKIHPELVRSLTGYEWRSRTTSAVHIDGAEVYLAVGQRLRAMLKDLDEPTRRTLTAGWVAAIRVDGELSQEVRVASRFKESLIKVKLDPLELQPTTRRVFQTCQRETYARMMNQGYTGASWFRYQVRHLDQQIGFVDTQNGNVNRRFFGNRSSSLTDTFALVSGGRALSENLQLGRQLPNPGNGAAQDTVDISKIAGITVREFDWTKHVAGIDPDLDPLSHVIPHDQHALFFADFSALVRFADEAAEQGTPVLRLAEPQGIDAMVRERYETQLGLSLDGLAELIGPQLIDTVAITGGDPYFRTGTDVAVMFTSDKMLALRTLLQVQTQLKSEQDPAAQRISGKLRGGTPYSGMKTDDNRIRSYMAVIGKAAIISNSISQLERIEEVSQGKVASLGSLDEYRYFRHRYPIGGKEESGLLIVTDATIRRWCSPKWRIATSRRTRAAAALLDLQSQYLGQLASGNMPAGRQIVASYEKAGTSTFVSSSSGLRSDSYGDMRFQTPIDEMQLPRVTPEEQRLYERWRNGYQRNWSNYFDPIAIQFATTEATVGLDMTVMPLIDFSQYREMVEISSGASLDDSAGDPHPESLLSWTLAVNVESQIVRQGVGMVSSFVSVSPLSWLGDDISIYIDQDPIWAKIATVESKSDIEDFLLKNIDGLPVAAQFDVKSGMRLTLFLTAVRGFIEQVAPKMLVWAPREHNDHGYVRIGLAAGTGEPRSTDEFDKLAIYYAASGDSLTVSLSEQVVHRAIDRSLARAEGKKLPAGPKRLGDNLAFHVDGGTLPMISKLFASDYQEAMQQVAYSNIPILNEWRRQFPDRNPVDFHQKFWHQRLMCPGGGKYVWNEEYQTMESTVYGHPNAPKIGPGLPPTLSQFSRGDFGLTFENEGLRARVELQRKVKK